jgi:pimeloyl-ACP methyl ester carboxylesterase
MTIHMTEVQEQLRALRSFGYGVLSFDYRGFGGNAGEPTEEGVYTDAESAYAYLTQNLRVPPTRVILAGRSLGSAVAVELATRVNVAGLVLFSPIDSVPLVGARLYPWFPVRHFARNQFDNLAKVDRLQSPVVEPILASNGGRLSRNRDVPSLINLRRDTPQASRQCPIGGAGVPSDHLPTKTMKMVIRSSGSSAAMTGEPGRLAPQLFAALPGI